MKTFKHIREARISGMPPGDHVFDTKVKGVEVMVHKGNDKKNPYITYVDKEMLDKFADLKSAKAAGLEFVKQSKG